MMSEELTYRYLRSKEEAAWPDRFSSGDKDGDLSLRVHRAISWIERAEQETRDDPDAKFIFYWIAFNAAYAADLPQEISISERDNFREYFDRLIRLDSDKRIFNAVWSIFPNQIRVILNNKFVFQPFWNYHNRVTGYDDWETRFQMSKRQVNTALGNTDTRTVLSILFDRLYVLRNQLIHGGATWRSSVNRNQVRDGSDIITFLVPVFVDLMMDGRDHDWGRPRYPVVS